MAELDWQVSGLVWDGWGTDGYLCEGERWGTGLSACTHS